MPWYSPDFEDLLAVAAATLDDAGTLIEANAGFRRIVRRESGPNPVGQTAAQVFVLPDYPTLLRTQPDADGNLHRGLLTLIDDTGRTLALRGRVWRVGAEVRLLAEYDISDLEQLFETILALNSGYASTQRGLTQTNLSLQRREADAVADSLIDALTGVGNRRRLEQALPVEVGRALRTGEPVCLLMADLDHFKDINDRYGHEIGDRVLQAFAALVQQQSRLTDVIARFGGEEFVVVMPGTDLAQASSVAERIRAALSALSIEPLSVPVTASFGVAKLAPGEGTDAWLRRADLALYEAKKGGRNRVALSQPDPA